MAKKSKPSPKKKEQDVSVVIRRADATDAIRIYNILKKHLIHSLPHIPAHNPDDTIQWVLETVRGGLVLVADMGGPLIGSLGGIMTAWPQNKQIPYFHGQWFFSLPEYEEYKVNVALLRKARRIANLSQIDMMFHMYGESAVDEKERLMLEEGFIDCGGVLMMQALVESDEPLQVQVRE